MYEDSGCTREKSNRSYNAINEAMAEVKKSGNLEIPKHIRNAPTQLMKQWGYGKNYDYPHNHDGHFAVQEYLGVDATYYEPGDLGYEAKIKERLEYWRGLRHAAKEKTDDD